MDRVEQMTRWLSVTLTRAWISVWANPESESGHLISAAASNRSVLAFSIRPPFERSGFHSRLLNLGLKIPLSSTLEHGRRTESNRAYRISRVSRRTAGRRAKKKLLRKQNLTRGQRSPNNLSSGPLYLRDDGMNGKWERRDGGEVTNQNNGWEMTLWSSNLSLSLRRPFSPSQTISRALDDNCSSYLPRVRRT